MPVRHFHRGPSSDRIFRYSPLIDITFFRIDIFFFDASSSSLASFLSLLSSSSPHYAMPFRHSDIEFSLLSFYAVGVCWARGGVAQGLPPSFFFIHPLPPARKAKAYFAPLMFHFLLPPTLFSVHAPHCLTLMSTRSPE